MVIWYKSNYLNKEVPALINTRIYEYDMVSGGFSILKRLRYFTTNEIKALEAMPKYERNVHIGLLLRNNSEMNNELIQGFKDCMEDFILDNDIPDEDILSIKKDAIFIRKPARVLEFEGGINFSLKNTYTSYYYLNQREFYFKSPDTLHVKGFSKEVSEYQEDFFFKELKNMFRLAEMNNKTSVIRYLKRFRSSYLNKELSKEFYWEMSRNPGFRYGKNAGDTSYILQSIDDVEDIEIGYNYTRYIVPLINIYL